MAAMVNLVCQDVQIVTNVWALRFSRRLSLRHAHGVFHSPGPASNTFEEAQALLCKRGPQEEERFAGCQAGHRKVAWIQ